MASQVHDSPEKPPRGVARTLLSLLRQGPRPLAMPIAVYPGARLIGRSVRELATDGRVQAAASEAVRSRLGLPIALTAMDLSVEAEAFGADVRFADDEVPTIIGRLIADAAEIPALRIPQVGRARTTVALEAVRGLGASGATTVMAGCIGPFSLAGRLHGVSEALELTLLEPDAAHALLEKATIFLSAFVSALKGAGAQGVLMAEPAAGLLSPAAVAEFSSCYVRRIREAVEDDGFTLILHNCGASLPHLPAILESGARILHFGAPMDLVAARSQAPKDVVLCGNLDPFAVFVGLEATAVADRTRDLIQTVDDRRAFVVSSGCDIPCAAPIESLEAFARAVRESATD